MRQFRNIVERWLRRIFDRPEAETTSVETEWFVETGGREAERAFAWHGMEGHEWEEFEE